MKTQSLLSVAILVLLSGCATLRGDNAAEKDMNTNGPTVLDVRTPPDPFQLNRNLPPTDPAMVFAEVKDFQSNISDVKLRFTHAPLELPMEYLGGTTWRAQL